jgi:hypothetical protein
LHVPSEPAQFQKADKSEPKVKLPWVKSVLRRSGEGMMVVMPSFSHRWQRKPWHIMGLHTGVIDEPTLRTTRVGNARDIPMHCCTRRYTNEDAPNEKWHSAERKENEPKRNLVQHPRAFEKFVESIACDFLTGIEFRRMIENEPAMEIAPEVFQHAVAVRVNVVACWLPLSPIARIVRTNCPQRSAHANERTEPDQASLDPFGAFKTAVN